MCVFVILVRVLTVCYKVKLDEVCLDEDIGPLIADSSISLIKQLLGVCIYLASIYSAALSSAARSSDISDSSDFFFSILFSLPYLVFLFFFLSLTLTYPLA